MKYCKKCVLPETSALNVSFDEEGVCSACRVAKEGKEFDWVEQEKKLRDILEQYRSKDKSNYDCLIGVSGGKDSYFITHTIKNVYGLNPLLVTYSHTWFSEVGKRNLENLKTKLGVDHIMFTPKPEVVKKLALISLRKIGDICWQCHAGISTYPVQIAVKFKIPLIIWGEGSLRDLAGMYTYRDLAEMNRDNRLNISLRGFDWYDMMEDGLTKEDLLCYVYPSIDEMEAVGVRGIYLGNYIPWDNFKQTELMIKEYGFESAPQERTFNEYENVECIYPGTHDYLRWIKFGYGRATDHACQRIRLGAMTREEGFEMVEKYDVQRPASLDKFLAWSGMTEKEFVDIAKSMINPRYKELIEKGDLPDFLLKAVKNL